MVFRLLIGLDLNLERGSKDMASLPFAGLDQPVATTAPAVQRFQARQVQIGRIGGVGAPAQATGSISASLDQVGRGLSAWGSVLTQQEQERQELEFLDNTTAFKDAERLKLDEVSQLQGEEAFRAPAIMEDFYKQHAESLIGKSRGDMQKRLATNFMAGARERGLDFAVNFRTKTLEKFKQDTLAGQEELLTRETAANPDQWRENVERFATLDAVVNRGQPEEVRAAKRANFADKQIKEAVQKEVALGNFDKAAAMVEDWGGVGSLGGLSAKYESSKAGINAIGWDSKGGTSYGTFQIASRTGTFKNFVQWLKDNNHQDVAEALSVSPADGGKRGNTAAIWKQLVADGKLTEDMEKAFIKETHYDVTMSKVSDPDLRTLINNHPALQDVVWSTATQHGGGGAAKIFNKAYKAGMSAEELIDSVYDKRTAAFANNPYREAATRRFKSEAKSAQRMLNSEGQNAALHQQLLRQIEKQKIEQEQELRVQAKNMTPAISDEMNQIMATGQDNPAIQTQLQQMEDQGILPIGAVQEYNQEKHQAQQVYNFISEPAAAASSLPDQIKRAINELTPIPGEDAGKFTQKTRMQEMVVKTLQDQLKKLNADPVAAVSDKATELVAKEINSGLVDGNNPAAIFEAQAALSRRLATNMGATIESMASFPLSKSQVSEYTATLEQAKTPMERLEILEGIYDSTGKESGNVFKQLNIPYNEVIAVEMNKSGNPALVRAARISINRPEKVTAATPTDFKLATQEALLDSDFASVVRGRLTKSRGLDLEASRSMDGMTVFAEGMMASLVESGKDLTTATRETTAALNEMAQGVSSVNDDYMSIYLNPDERGEVPDQTAVVAGLRRLSQDFGDDYYWVNDGDDNFVLVSQMTGKIMPHNSTKSVRVSRQDAAYIGDPEIQPSFFQRITGRAAAQRGTITQRVEEVIGRMGEDPAPEDQHQQFIESLRGNSVKMGQL